MFNLFRKKVTANSGIFANNYIDAKALYLHRFNKLPSVTYIDKIDISQAYDYLIDRFESHMSDVLRHAEYRAVEEKLFFNVILMILPGDRLIEVGSDYVSILHNTSDYRWINEIMEALGQFRIVVENRESFIGFRAGAYREESINN